MPTPPSAHRAADGIVARDVLSAIERNPRTLRRLCAFGLDAFLLLGLSELIVWIVFRLAGGDAGPGGAVLPWLVPVETAATLLLGAGYFVVGWVLLAATPGQRILRLLVVRTTDAQPLRSGAALLRWIALGAPLWIGAASLPGLAGAASLFALVLWWCALLSSTVLGRDGRGLHDRLAGSAVVSRGRRTGATGVRETF